MAKAYRALSKIDHGEGTHPETGRPLGRTFPFGSLVTGLPTEVMKQLWDAGVLEEVDVPDAVLQDATTENDKRNASTAADSPPAASGAEPEVPKAPSE